jgi:hypothetical protein
VTSRHLTGGAERSQPEPAARDAPRADDRALLATCVAAAVRATEIIRALSADAGAVTWEEKFSSATPTRR